MNPINNAVFAIITISNKYVAKKRCSDILWVYRVLGICCMLSVLVYPIPNGPKFQISIIAIALILWIRKLRKREAEFGAFSPHF